MSPTLVLLLDEIQDETPARLAALFPGVDFVDARPPDVFDSRLPRATILYGRPSARRLPEAAELKWIQLLSAGVPRSLCPPARDRGIVVTNLAGLYGPSIAEHAVCLMSLLGRNLHLALRNQHAGVWDNSINNTMKDLSGRTAAVVGLGDIGRAVARLAKAYGMRVLGTRRTPKPTAFVDCVYPLGELRAMLAEADFVVVAAPLTAETEGLLGPDEFAAMKPGVIYVNVSRGGVADETALLDALRSGRVAAAGLDVFATEPLPAGHPFWAMPQVVVSPHYSGDTVNLSSLPLERFTRNLRAWLSGGPLEGVVDLERGY